MLSISSILTRRVTQPNTLTILFSRMRSLAQSSHESPHFRVAANLNPIAQAPKDHQHQVHRQHHNPVENAAAAEAGNYTFPAPVYSEAELLGTKITRRSIDNAGDAIAYGTVQTMRSVFDVVSGYRSAKKNNTLSAQHLLTRMIFLETVAGVPGMVAGMTRHLISLGFMRRDKGWINCLLAEAENERMHLLTFLKLKKPGRLFHLGVLGLQAVFWPTYFTAYVLAPSVCHRFIGYLEEEAVVTYSNAIEMIDDGTIPEWKTKAAPRIAKDYWHLAPDATMRDVLLAVRADESNHRDVNHGLGDIDQHDANPFARVKKSD